AHDVNSPARHRAHKALTFQLRHGLAHRRAADAQLLGQAAFVEPDFVVTAIDVHADDDGFERGIGFVFEAERSVDRFQARPLGTRELAGIGSNATLAVPRYAFGQRETMYARRHLAARNEGVHSLGPQVAIRRPKRST